MNFQSFEEINEDGAEMYPADEIVSASEVLPAPKIVETNVFYPPNEICFAQVAPIMVPLGWSVFPQEMTGRMPGKVDGRTIRWSEDYDLKNKRPDAETLELWSRKCPTLNVACVFGPASGNTFAIDIDVTDEDMSVEIADLADEILGYTPFRREGREPKIALIYRHSADDVVPSRKRKIEGTEYLIEILGSGGLLTFYGRHHKTGKYFKWLKAAEAPLLYGPEHAVEVSSAKVDEFLSAVDKLYKLSVGFSGSNGCGPINWENCEGIRIPHIEIPKDWAVDASGRIIDNREEYLKTLVWRTVVLGNGEIFHAAKESGQVAIDEYKAKIGGAVMQEFAAKAATSGRWSISGLSREVSSRVGNLVAKALAGLIEIKAQPPKARTVDRKRELPTITIKAGEITEAVDAVEAALIAADLGLYQRSGHIVSLGYAPVEVSSGGEVTGQSIMEVGKHGLLEQMSKAAVFERFDARKGAPVRIDPPMSLVETFLDRVGSWKLPVLAGFINAPTMRADGTILDTPGYDHATGLLFDPQGKTFPAIKDKPTREDALKSLCVLNNMISTFPFVSEVDKSVANSGFLTAVVRRTMRTAPLHGFSASTPGSGKSTLVDIASIIATGREAGVIAQASKEEEMEKRLGAMLMAGETVVAIDNCEHPIDGAFLCQVLTQTRVKARVLCKSEVLDLLSNSLFFATGNNLVYQGDITRRALKCVLEANMERPETRVFDVQPIPHAKANRIELVTACLTMLRAFQVAGKPAQSTPLGSYEQWSSTVRDALIWLGEADPVLCMDVARDEDPKLEAVRNVIYQWNKANGGQRSSVAELIGHASRCKQYTQDLENPEFFDALFTVASEGRVISSRRLGIWLGRNKTRWVSGAKIDKMPLLDGNTTYALTFKDEQDQTA